MIERERGGERERERGRESGRERVIEGEGGRWSREVEGVCSVKLRRGTKIR